MTGPLDHTRVFNTWFFDRPEVIDFWGLGGSGALKPLQTLWGGSGPGQIKNYTCSDVLSNLVVLRLGTGHRWQGVMMTGPSDSGFDVVDVWSLGGPGGP